MQPAGDHQVQNQPEIAFYPNRNALADAPQLTHDAAFNIRKRWLDGTKQKRARQSYVLDWLANNPRFKRANVSGDIWQFRHVQ